MLSKEMDTAAWVEILDEVIHKSHFANTLGKSMLPTILPLHIIK